MFKANQKPLQRPLLGGTAEYLDDKKQKILEESWAETFRQEVLLRIDEKVFEGMYSEEKSRPNTPVNVLVGWEIIKTGAGLDDRSMHERFLFDIQVRHALGLDDLNEGDFSLRTIYNFRSRVRKYELKTEKDLIKECFKQVTDGQMKSWQIKSEEARVDSVQVRSNIAKMGRLQLVIESVRRIEKMLDEEDREKYGEVLMQWTGKRGMNYVYEVAAGTYQNELEKIGHVVQRLAVELAEKYGEQEPYKAMCRIFKEQYKMVGDEEAEGQVEIQADAENAGTDVGIGDDVSEEQPLSEKVVGPETKTEEKPCSQPATGELVVDETVTDEFAVNAATSEQVCGDVLACTTTDTVESPEEGAQSFVVRDASEIPSGSVQSPDDLEATYRTKAGENYQGYVTNIVETSSSDNDFQLIIDVRTDSNNVDDAQLLLDALPDLRQRTDMNEVHTDGGYISPELDQAFEEAGIQQRVTAIRGRQPDPHRITLAHFEIHESDGVPRQITCPEGQQIPVEQGRTDTTFIARPDPKRCQQCPLLAVCAANPSKEAGTPTIYFNLQALRNARRRQWLSLQPDGSNPRAAVEATVRSVTHPLPHHKVPLRGKHNVSRYMIYSAMMVNVRRLFGKIHRDLHDFLRYLPFLPAIPFYNPLGRQPLPSSHSIVDSPPFNPLPLSLSSFRSIPPPFFSVLSAESIRVYLWTLRL